MSRVCLLGLALLSIPVSQIFAAGFRSNTPGFFISAVPVAPDVYRIDVTPAAETTISRGRAACHSPGGQTKLSLNDGWLEITRDKETIWKGRVLKLDSYGRLQGPGIRLEWKSTPEEIIYGLGQRFNGLNQNGRWVEMWNREEPGQGPEGRSSYFCAPVLYSSRGYGLFASDNPEGEVDLNTKNEGLFNYGRAGTTLTLYLAAAPTLKELVLARARIQGPFRGIPDWAWGPWISRNSFENQGEAEQAVHEMIRRNLPVAAIVQEAWKGRSETGDWNNFSKERWPNVDGFLALCRSNGIQNVLWQVPVIHPSSPDFTNAAARGYFVRAPDGSVSLRDAWLKGCANIDFTHPDAVRWWKDQMRDEVRRGIRGCKADDGEDIKPNDVFFDGRRGWEMHNEYTALYAKALRELFDEEKVEGMLWCRSASLGCERTPALWAGDQYATWPQYRRLISAGLSAGLSGAPFWGHDIGGYLGTPAPELYIRWLQFGTFSPLMQYHGTTRREPWEFGDEAEKAYALLSRLRMNLRPTLKKLGAEAARTGVPIMRPMIMEFPGDSRFLSEDTQYMLGPDILVAPVLDEHAKGRVVRFPAGEWRQLLQPVSFRGPSDQIVPIGLVDAPVFVRAGATLDVELTESGKLGEWNAAATVRKIKFQAEGKPALRKGRVEIHL